MFHYLYISPGDGVMINPGEFQAVSLSLGGAKEGHSTGLDKDKDARILSIDSAALPQPSIVYGYYLWEEYDPEFGYWYNMGDRYWQKEIA